MKLYICEKPSQAKDIAAVLGAKIKTQSCFEGQGIAVTWCIGHLLELMPPDHYCEHIKPWRMEILPIVPKIWVLKPQEKTKKQLKAIEQLLKKATSVVIATDADREGDVIGREVLEYCNYKGPVERLWLSALDESSIKKALNSIRPGSSTESIYQAGLGRARADWLIGMNLTMAVSCLFSVPGQGVLSVGRVQTPTLKLVVDRDLSIEHFKPCDYFVLQAQCTSMSDELFWTTWDMPEEVTDSEGRCINQSLIEAVAQRISGQTGIVKEYQEVQKKEAPPLCPSLSSLQKIASAQWGFSAKQTLDVAQSLYEHHKAITYPRTDCGYLPISQFAEAPTILKVLGQIDKELEPLISLCSPQYQSRAWNDKKITAHHGIIPTANIHVALHSMTTQERMLYELIRAYYLAQFLGDYELLYRVVFLEIEGYLFKSSNNTPLVLGWKKAFIKAADEEKSSETLKEFQESIPKLTEGHAVKIITTQSDSRKTQPAPRFTEGTLITAMKSIAKYVDNPQLKKILKETAGIGTEATRANILETLISREYIKRQGKQLISTPKGRCLIQKLPPSITNPATTALWEQVLDGIANGVSEITDFLDDQSDTLTGMLEQLVHLAPAYKKPCEVSQFSCPECQKNLYRREGKKGFWWGCSGFPECKTTFLDNKGAPRITVLPKHH
ncbi:DNA topoisomerase III [Legionella taurinensis]|uniref:DNA topoisomerase III n=1 Tax=Legionella taurinensis TaxID=70611 RepID=UPI00299F4E4A|nr:DNA topoisomerase III [Legionella taurinensis]MDX1838123.1 DNA topoisomerase III [Legionella taurinensis]